MTHETYYKLFIYKALILAKSKELEESEQFMQKALKIKLDTFGDINIYEHVAWKTERLAMIGQSKYEEMFLLICDYIEMFKQAYCKISFKDDAFLKYQFLLKIAPDILTLHECQFPEGHRFYAITEHRASLISEVSEYQPEQRVSVMICSYNIMFSQSQQDAIRVKSDINSNLQIAATLDKEHQKINPSYNS